MALSNREKMKLAKKASQGSTAWGGKKIDKDSSDKCRGCQKRFRDMTAAQFTRHVKAEQNGDDCPDV